MPVHPPANRPDLVPRTAKQPHPMQAHLRPTRWPGPPAWLRPAMPQQHSRRPPGYWVKHRWHEATGLLATTIACRPARLAGRPTRLVQRARPHRNREPRHRLICRGRPGLYQVPRIRHPPFARFDRCLRCWTRHYSTQLPRLLLPLHPLHPPRLPYQPQLVQRQRNYLPGWRQRLTCHSQLGNLPWPTRLWPMAMH